MDEKTPNDVDWADLQLFLAVARDGGLSPAARRTGRSPATLGRRMLGLERALGRDLFVRHDRGYALTSDGRALLTDLGGVETRLDRLSQPITSKAPIVKISAGSWTTLYMLTHLNGLEGEDRDLRLRFISAEATLDISRREAVIGLRNRRPTEDTLAARRAGRNEFAPYAIAKAPDRWIKVIGTTPSAQWLNRHVGGDACVEVTSPRNSLDLALAGHGMALLPTFIGDAQPALQRRGDTIPDLSHDQWIVSHQDDRHFPEVRRALTRLYALFVPTGA
ncbi:LysR family transcriptional regulator [Gymnodinialimonas sp. 2305UL16-5]|uniref:LysR family transcriptional regulator n=1 Tax=Gymnodinialimonas mytili TaxID=3126503 RepID=UPI0030A5B454